MVGRVNKLERTCHCEGGCPALHGLKFDIKVQETLLEYKAAHTRRLEQILIEAVETGTINVVELPRSLTQHRNHGAVNMQVNVVDSGVDQRKKEI